MSDIQLKITDRDGKTHNVIAPVDMAMNLMEVIWIVKLVIKH